MRLFVTAIVLFALIVGGFLLWGDRFEALFGGREAAVEYLRGFGAWAWAVAIGLLVADIVLPVPATPIFVAVGIIYGPMLGGVVGTVGSYLSATVAYTVCRGIGTRAALFLLGRKDFKRGHRFFSHSGGGWLVALSRWMIIFPEMVACFAGLTRMPAVRFFVALACGTVPMCFAYAALGAAADHHPWLAVVISGIVPATLWPVAQVALRGRSASGARAAGNSTAA